MPIRLNQLSATPFFNNCDKECFGINFKVRTSKNGIFGLFFLFYFFGQLCLKAGINM